MINLLFSLAKIENALLNERKSKKFLILLGIICIYLDVLFCIDIAKLDHIF